MADRWEVECEPACGFKLRSHDKNEIVSMVKQHAGKAHQKQMSDKEILNMAKEV